MRQVPPPGRRGSILLVAALFAFILYSASIGLSGSVMDRVLLERDGADSLRSELAAESGLEYAQRRLLLDPDWAGTGPDGVALPDGSRFTVAAEQREQSAFGADAHVLDVVGASGEGRARFSGGVRVHGGGGGSLTADQALIFLGQDFKMTRGGVRGNALLVDRAGKCDDWMFDAQGEGYYAASHGPASDGLKQFYGAGVEGTLYKYRDDLAPYQALGEEVVIEANTAMPSWDLAEFEAPRPGQVNLTNPHNLGNEIWKLEGLSYDETVVIELTNDQTVTLTNCSLRGGLVVLSPFAQDPRLGNSNLVHVKKGTAIGGGAGGVHPNIGLIAPGSKLKSDVAASAIEGFSLVKEVDLFRLCDIRGQFVILEACKGLIDCRITYLSEVGGNPPPFVTFGAAGGRCDVLGVHENFE